MTDNRETNNLLYLMLGLIGGGIVVYLLVKSMQQQPALSTMSPQPTNIYHIYNQNPYSNSIPVQDKPISPIPQVQTSNIDNTQNIDNTIYKNDEKWNIVRDEYGNIRSVNILRDVKVDK